MGGEEWYLGGWAVPGKGKPVVHGRDQQALGAGHTLTDHPSSLQVTIVSPEPGAASGKSAGTQGDMEKLTWWMVSQPKGPGPTSP